jgi:hypothetical protein
VDDNELANEFIYPFNEDNGIESMRLWKLIFKIYDHDRNDNY